MNQSVSITEQGITLEFAILIFVHGDSRSLAAIRGGLECQDAVSLEALRNLYLGGLKRQIRDIYGSVDRFYRGILRFFGVFVERLLVLTLLVVDSRFVLIDSLDFVARLYTSYILFADLDIGA